MSTGAVSKVHLEAVISKVMTDIAYNVDEDDAIGWLSESLRLIGTPRVYEEAVCFQEVLNKRCLLPQGCKELIAIARNNRFNMARWGNHDPCLPPNYYYSDQFGKDYQACLPAVSEVVCPANVGTPETCPKNPILLDCDGKALEDYDVAYYRPFFDLIWEYEMWRGWVDHDDAWERVTLSDHQFFGSLVCKEHDVDGLYNACGAEYTIKWPYLYFNFECGFVGIAHRKLQLDPATGYPYIPDDEQVKNAMISYVRMKMKDREADREPRQAVNSERARNNWETDCKRARAAMKEFSWDEQHNYTNRMTYMLPRSDYHSYFGNLNRKRRPGAMYTGQIGRVYRTNDHGGIVYTD